MQCPVCSVPLQMTERQGVEIDYCPQCRGVWLDRGELDKILERSAQAEAPPPRASQVPPDRLPTGYPQQQPGGYRESRDRHYDDDYYKRKRRKNWLEEIFD